MLKKTLLLILAVFVLGGLGACAKKKIDSRTGGGSAQEKSYRLNQKTMREAQQEEKKRLAEEKETIKERRLKEKKEKERLQATAEKKRKEAIQKITGKMIHFSFDSFDLSSKARNILQKKAKLLKKYSDLRIVIEGYCDERGTEEYNLALGERRARAAYEFLILLGVDSNRMQIVSYGEEDPIDPANNEAAWAKNRRAEFKIVE